MGMSIFDGAMNTIGNPSQPGVNPGGPFTPRPDLGPGVGFGVGLPSPVDEFGNPMNTDMMPPQGLPTGGGTGGKGIGGMLPGIIAGQMPQLPGGAQLPGLPQAGQFPGQQQPITQGNGQLPPGFGALSPIDRSQISPGASIGFGMPPQGYGMPPQGAGQMVGGPAGRPIMNPPVNRFAPPNAPGVRPTMSPQQQAQFGAAGQLGSARANLMSGRAPVSNAVASRMPAKPNVSRSPQPVRRTK